MSIGYRAFVVEDDNSIVAVSHKALDDFYFKEKPALAKFAGRTVTIAIAYYTLERRRPKQIIRIDCQRLKVDRDGAMDADDHSEELRLAANCMDRLLAGDGPRERRSGSVVDAALQFDQRRRARRHPPLPGPAHKRILEVLFGTSAAI